MARVTFRLDFKTTELSALELPIEVRKPNATLITTALSSETIDVPPGPYYATTRLPGGQRLVAPFEIGDPPPTDPLEVVLAPDPEDASAHEWEEVSHFLGRRSVQQPEARPLREGRIASAAASNASDHAVRARQASPGALHLRVFSGNVVRHQYAQEPATQILQRILVDRARLVQFEVPSSVKLLFAQLVQPGGPVQNLALPVSPEAGAQLIVCQREGEFRMEAHLKNHAADMLLQYSSYGAANTASVASRSEAVDGERLLRDKMTDPIAAAVGAYCILRIGDVTRLHDWTQHLRERFAWMPDGAAIHGEHLARMGRHAAALDAFAEVPVRGLPILADGLFYAVERLKLYASRTWKGQDPVDGGRAQSVLDELQPFALLMRRQRPISAYPGLDLSVPDTKAAATIFTSAQSIDLGKWFGPGAPDDPTSPGPLVGSMGG
jgi:hypothetical protein